MNKTTAAFVAIAITIGLAFRLWEAFESSLWLDELHSIAHASPATIGGVLEHTHWDFHVPLFFVGLHFVWQAARPEMLRLVPIVANLLVLVPLLVFVRRSRLGASAPAVAAMLFALLPFQILYATELRPYAFLMLASATACCAAFTDAGSKRLRFALFTVSVAFGLYSHYLMAFTVLLVGATRLVFIIPPLRGDRSAARSLLGLGWIVLAGALGVAAFLPWVLRYMFWVVETPEELIPPDAATQVVTEAHRLDLMEAPIKTLVPVLRSLGGSWTALAAAGAVLLAAGIAVAAAAWIVAAAKKRLPRADRATALAVTFAFLSAIILGMSIWGWSRVSIRYVCISAWLWPLVVCELLAAVPRARLRAVLVAMILVGALLAAIAHCGGRTREDVRGAVATARALGDEIAVRFGTQPFYTALLSQPPRFEHGTPYLAYARDIRFVELKDAAHAGAKPPLLPRRGEPGFERPVVVITRRYRDLDRDTTLAGAQVLRLREGRRTTRKVAIDDTMSVWVFEPDR